MEINSAIYSLEKQKVELTKYKFDSEISIKGNQYGKRINHKRKNRI